MSDAHLNLAQVLEDHWRVLAIVLPLVAAGLVYLQRDFWAGGFGPMIVWKIVERLGLPAVHDAYLPYAGGVKMVDHIVLAGDTVLVIQYASLSGKITGQAHEATWRSDRGDGPARIPNPLRQNFSLVQAVQERVGPDVEVVGVVTFIGDATFPKGLPDGVYAPRSLRRYLRDLSRRGTGSSILAWNWLAGMLARGDEPADVALWKPARKSPGCQTAIKLRHQGL